MCATHAGITCPLYTPDGCDYKVLKTNLTGYIPHQRTPVPTYGMVAVFFTAPCRKRHYRKRHRGLRGKGGACLKLLGEKEGFHLTRYHSRFCMREWILRRNMGRRNEGGKEQRKEGTRHISKAKQMGQQEYHTSIKSTFGKTSK